MNPDPAEALAEIEELCSLVKTGQLFVVQKWLAEGKPYRLTATDDNRVCPLLVAVDSGFHSMVEVLAKAGGWSQETLDTAFEAATSNHRSDIANLLRQQGASMQALDFAEVCRSMNQTFMEEALRGGCSAVQGNAFAAALRRSAAARPLLSFYRRMRGEFPELDNQAALSVELRWAETREAVDAELLRLQEELHWDKPPPQNYPPTP